MTTINLKAAGGTVAGYALYWTDPNGFEARRAMGKTSAYDDWVLGSKDTVHDGVGKIWDHLTHMDAYEAGNLTFDIAPCFSVWVRSRLWPRVAALFPSLTRLLRWTGWLPEIGRAHV